MVESLTCKHCNGTTFCGGSLGAGGKLKKSPACITCVVKSGLNPSTIHDRVVCSVCGGVGVVQPRKESIRAAPTPLWMFLVVPLFAATVVSLILTMISYNLELAKNKELQDKLGERWSIRRETPVKEVLSRVVTGMKKADVKATVGDPDVTYVPNSAGPEGEREFWYYNCADGVVAVLFVSDTVQKVNLETRPAVGMPHPGKVLMD
jgi:hypothetical protein